jgi:hypothetical protein
MAPEGVSSALPTPGSYEWFTHAGESIAPNWQNEVSLESMEAFLEYNPAANTPDLTYAPPDDRGRGDTLTPTDLDIPTYERVLESKSLVVMEGEPFDAYTRPGLSHSRLRRSSGSSGI